MVSANGLPHYSFVQTTPNALRSQNFNWVVPRFPELAMDTSTIPLLGTVAFSVNGVPIYGPNEAQFPDPFGDPVYNDLLDECLGHTGGQGDYHYHAMFVRCLSAIGLEGVEDRSVPSPILGYALDGFPIYGPLGCVDEACTSIVEFKSGWIQTGDPTTYAWDNHAYQPSMTETSSMSVMVASGRTAPTATMQPRPFLMSWDVMLESSLIPETMPVAAGEAVPAAEWVPPRAKKRAIVMRQALAQLNLGVLARRHLWVRLVSQLATSMRIVTLAGTASLCAVTKVSAFRKTE